MAQNEDHGTGLISLFHLKQLVSCFVDHLDCFYLIYGLALILQEIFPYYQDILGIINHRIFYP